MLWASASWGGRRSGLSWEAVLAETRLSRWDVGAGGTVLAQGPSAPVTKVAAEWATAGMSSVGTPWAEPDTQVGRDTCLDRMAVFSMVLFRGAADTVEAAPSATATTPGVGSVAPTSRPGAVPVA